MTFLSEGTKLFSKQVNTIPSKFKNTVIHGDSNIMLKELPDNCIDLIVTSPPYNFDREYDSIDDNVEWKLYFDKLFSIFSECIRVTKYGGRIAIVVQPCYSKYKPTHHIISDFFMKQGLIWRSEILWEKNNYNAKYTAWGSWRSPSNPYMKYSWEFIEVFSKGSLKHAGKNIEPEMTATEFQDWTFGRWSIAPEIRMKEFNHPAMFPEALVTRLIKLFSFAGDTILDPFNGMGTTTKVAKELKRNYVGIDISEDYVKTAIKRLRSVVLYKSLFTP